MKKILIPSLMMLAASLNASEAPLWMRYPAISPDGETIVFSYKGDIYSVPTKGGLAKQLTTHPKHDTHPIWSPDGKSIAFSSDREGSFDIYIMSKDGGEPKRLTTNTAAETPEVFKDNNTILFSSALMPDVNDSQFPSAQFPQIYSVDVNGGRPQLYSSLAMQEISVSNDGKLLLYQDMKGYEDPWRKHHTSSITKDIWVCNADKSGDFKKITSFKGEDRNPLWTNNNNSFYYLSEENGSFNVYKYDINGNSKKQITNHSKHPVRFLSSSKDGLLCYSFDGEIYTIKEGEQAKKVNIEIISDNIENELISKLLKNGASDISVSPNGKEVVFIAHGDVYTTSVDYSTTKRITNTPQQERDPSFSPDGRTIVYAAERGKTWGVYTSTLTDKEEKLFTYATDIKEEPLIVSDETSFQPAFSPDGKEIAYLANRTELRVYNLASKKIRTVLDGKYNYSYSDGDQTYQWSPDSKWFVAKYIDIGGWNNTDIVLVKADGSGEMTNLTMSGYSDGNPKWVLDGKAMIWSSDRAGYRSHGSWGAEEDVYIMFFDGEAYDKFNMSKEEVALEEFEEEEKEDKDEKDKKDEGKDKDKEKDKTKVEDLKFDLDNRSNRIKRLTINSSRLGDAVLTKKGDKLYYCSAFEKGFDLWEHNFKENTTKLLIKDVGAGTLYTDEKEENLFLVSGGKLKKVNIKDNKVENIDFEADFDYQPAKEREYIFNHAWRQVKDKFYDENIHGIDWEGYKTAYAKFLPHINNNYDFQEMLSELLGELNGSHTGARYRPALSVPATSYLGAFFDNSYKGDGLKIAEIIEQGPLTKADSKIEKGCIIEKINGNTIKHDTDYFPMLAGKEGKNVVLSVYNPNSGKRFNEVVKPISQGKQSELLYKRWVKQKREMVDKLSGGKIGYVHVKGMNSESFRETYSELLGRCRNKEAVIVDTRHNGGGWLHEDLAVLLSGKEYQRFEPRGQYIGSDPYNRWLKPSCVLVCEDNYSNAHGFPFVYKTLGIGKLIGAPVPGTMTAVWWETQIDPTLIFGIPQVGVKDMSGKYLENQQLQPDIEIYNSPESQLEGKDIQLEKAVEEMLKTIKK